MPSLMSGVRTRGGSRAGSFAALMRAAVLATLCGVVPMARTQPADAPGERNCTTDRGQLGKVQMLLVDAALKLGFERAKVSHRPITGCLGPQHSRTLAVRLEAAREYAVVAVCEQPRCVDIDLALFDDAGQLVDADLEPGAQPRLKISTRRAASYRLQVTLPICEDKPDRGDRICAFALGVFERQRAQ